MQFVFTLPKFKSNLKSNDRILQVQLLAHIVVIIFITYNDGNVTVNIFMLPKILTEANDAKVVSTISLLLL